MLDVKPNKIKWRSAWLIAASVAWMCASGKVRGQIDTDSIKITTDQHDDMGPDDRYAVPYEPITYGQDIKAPLPGLAYDYKLVDWNQDGLVDILANLRRGGGVVFYKNVGTRQQPLYRSLQENQRLMDKGQLGRYFDVIDIDRDGTYELLGFEGQNNISKLSDEVVTLNLYVNRGSPEQPEWKQIPVVQPNGKPIAAPADVWNAPRLYVADWDSDGKEDLIIGYESVNETVPPEVPQMGSNRMFGFRDTTTYQVNSGKVFFLKNLTTNPAKPTFAAPKRIEADGQPISTYIHPYPTVFDEDGDGKKDLLVGTHRAEIRVFRNIGTSEQPRLTDAGLLQDEEGNPIRTFLTVRTYPADLDADGIAELIASSYFGNQDRYLVYQRQGLGWKNTDYLKIRADAETPVYGMGNSTVDPVDWDGDGDTDLLLGAEGSFPTLVENVGSEKDRKFLPARRLEYVDGSLLETFSVKEGVGSVWGPLEWYSDRIAPRAVDWDGDGVLDIISGSMGRRLYFFKGKKVDNALRFGKPRNFRFNDSTLVLPDRLFPGVVDWNGDGKPDLILSDDPGHIIVYEGNESLKLSNPTRLNHPDGSPLVLHDFWERKKGNRSGFTTADWDQDGHRDLIVYEFHRGIFLFRNTGNGTFEEEKRLVPLYSHLAGPSVMDWDDDGYLDLIIGGDERRMIEPSIPAHLVVFHGEDLELPPVAEK